MSKAAIQTSQRFSRAARAERDRLDRKRSQLYKRRETLQAKVDALDEELEAVDQQLQVLEDFAGGNGGAIEIREVNRSDEDAPELLSGSFIRILAVPLLIREHGLSPIHYRDWYVLLNKAGYAAAGKRPDAVFLNQIARSPLVRATTKSGYYVLDLTVVEQLRAQLGKQQAELAELMQNVPDDSVSLEAHRHRQRELSTAVNRTERDLREAVSAIEVAENAATSEAKAA
jgi:predicted nuclease with TOPRIM domain